MRMPHDRPGEYEQGYGEEGEGVHAGQDLLRQEDKQVGRDVEERRHGRQPYGDGDRHREQERSEQCDGGYGGHVAIA
jgi:hypothetical protein